MSQSERSRGCAFQLINTFLDDESERPLIALCNRVLGVDLSTRHLYDGRNRPRAASDRTTTTTTASFVHSHNPLTHFLSLMFYAQASQA